MKRLLILAFAALPLLASGCVNQQQAIASKEPLALKTALDRGRFDLACPAATGTVLSSDFIQPAIQGPFVDGLQRIEFTIGVAGCDKRAVYVVMCQEEGDTCFAATQDGRFRRD